MKSAYTWYLSISLLCSVPSHAAGLLTFFFRPYAGTSEKLLKKISTDLKTAGKIARKIVKQKLYVKTSGIFSTYAGYLNVSDINGETAFPLRHTEPYIDVVVCTKVIPVMQLGNTIHHWEIGESTPYAVYRYSYTIDPETKNVLWKVERGSLENNVIPLRSILIFATEKSIVVPQGTFVGDHQSPHMILPDIYVTKGVKITAEALYILNLTPYFAPIKRLYQQQQNWYAVHISE